MNKTYPKTEFTAPPPSRTLQQPATRSPFSPINPEQAKESVKRPDSEVRALWVWAAHKSTTQLCQQFVTPSHATLFLEFRHYFFCLLTIYGYTSRVTLYYLYL